MAKGKNNLSSNPMDSFRKNKKKRDLKKNKEVKTEQKNQQLLTTDLKKFDMLVGKYRKLEREGQLDETGKAKLEQVLKNRQKAIDLKREKGLLKLGQGNASVTSLGHLGDSEDIEEDEDQYEDYGQNSLGDHYLEELSSDNLDSDDEEEYESAHLDIEVEGVGKLDTIPTTQVESIIPLSTKQSDKFSLPPLPSGSPPISAKIIPNPVPLPPKVQPKSKLNTKSSQKTNPPFIPPHIHPSYYGATSKLPNQMYRPPPSSNIPPRPTFHPIQAPPSALSSSHYSSAPQLNNNPPNSTTQPKSVLEVLSNTDPDTTKEAVVISVEPELRDLKKDLVTMVPASLKRKIITSKPTSSQATVNASSSSASLKAFKPNINAAPTFSDDEDEFDKVNLPTSSKSNVSVQNSTQSKTQKDYEDFLKQMEGLL